MLVLCWQNAGWGLISFGWDQNLFTDLATPPQSDISLLCVHEDRTWKEWKWVEVPHLAIQWSPFIEHSSFLWLVFSAYFQMCECVVKCLVKFWCVIPYIEHFDQSDPTEQSAKCQPDELSRPSRLLVKTQSRSHEGIVCIAYTVIKSNKNSIWFNFICTGLLTVDIVTK